MLDRMLLAAGGEEKLYVEDVFSTYLYTGTGTTPQTITNGIDLAGKGGAVWVKCRDTAGYNNWISGDGNNNGLLCTNTTSAAIAGANAASSWQYTSTGMNILSSALSGAGGSVNGSGKTFASWTFRKAPKFFDVVTWTGDGTFKRVLNHSLGVAPGFIVVKRTDTTSNWWTYHRGVAGSINGYLNLTNAFTNTGYVEPGSVLFGENPAAVFDVFNAGSGDDLNVNGGTYVAYLFAHDATADGIIQCGSFTTDGSGAWSVNLGWEPQWVLMKRADNTGSWTIHDNMRGIPTGGTDPVLWANLSNAELNASNYLDLTATGFRETSGTLGASGTNIYIAIRRGPMKTPTVGTSVFKPDFLWGTSTSVQRYLGYPADTNILGYRDGGVSIAQVTSRLTGPMAMNTSQTTAQSTDGITWDTMLGSNPQSGSAANRYINYAFRRAPGFFDVVCYTPAAVTGTAVKHNLGVVPELVISKSRTSSPSPWLVYAPVLGDGQRMRLNSTEASSAQFTAGKPATSTEVYENHQVGNFPAAPWVAYLFASCPGVSKVGSYTGNGSSQTINCGFSSGARFFLVKRTDSTGDWWVYDSARGIVAAADPALALNSTAAEVTSADAVDTDSTGIIVNQEATCNINVNGATYIYLAIA